MTDDVQLTNVLEAFRLVFPNTILDQEDQSALASMPLDCTCGDDCAAAINAAQSLMKSVHMAYGETGDYAVGCAQQLSDVTASVCVCFITG